MLHAVDDVEVLDGGDSPRIYVISVLAASRKNAVDRARGEIFFRQVRDRRDTSVVKTTKTELVRQIPIESALYPLLRRLLASTEGDYVIYVPHSKRSERLRQDLRAAGITRTELFSPTDGVAATWAGLTYHDLRGTGVTWMALRGDNPLVIQQRAGHTTFATTQRYLREAETLGHDDTEPFPALPDKLITGKTGLENGIKVALNRWILWIS